MKILILGGTQFNGLHFAHHMYQKGHDVSVFNRGLSPGIIPKEVHRFYGDRYHFSQLKKALGSEKFDLVYDFCGYLPDNVERVMEFFANKTNRFIYISTTAVYAKTQKMPVDENYELDTSFGQSVYGRNKALCEQAVLKISAMAGIPFTIIRPPMIMGSCNPLDYREQKMFSRILNRRPIPIIGSGQTRGQIAHVKDQAEVLELVGQTSSTVNQTYNLISLPPFTDLEYVRAFEQVLGIQAQLFHLKDKAVSLARDLLTKPSIQRPEIPFYDWDEDIFYNDQKLRQALNWKPRFDLVSAVREAYVWYSESSLSWHHDFSDEQSLLMKLDFSSSIPQTETIG